MCPGAPAHEYHLIGVGDPLRDERINPREHVERLVLEVMADDVAVGGVAVSGAAAIVRSKDDVALAGQHCEITLEKPRPCTKLVGFRRSAVQLDDERILSAAFVVGRIEEQAIYRRAVRA